VSGTGGAFALGHDPQHSRQPSGQEEPRLAGQRDHAIAAGVLVGFAASETLDQRRDDALAYFSHRDSIGLTEVINGRLGALRRNALGFRNLSPFVHSDGSSLALDLREPRNLTEITTHESTPRTQPHG
jgi:hypothetical protein